tara:strand:- start:47 stop:343 length:297 start_codon:yes stop_codon:yes gene_type:complete
MSDTPQTNSIAYKGYNESAYIVLLDDDRTPTRAGDTVSFNYGIPPVAVRAKIVQRGRSLIALTPGHTPVECNLRTLRRYVGGWLKQNVSDQTRAEGAK